MKINFINIDFKGKKYFQKFQIQKFISQSFTLKILNDANGEGDNKWTCS